MNRPRLRLADLHWPLILVVSLIALLGVYNLHSAAAASHDPDLYLTQAAWLGLAAAAVALSLFVDYRVTESIAYPFFAIILLLLLLVLTQGRVAKGAARWLHLGPFGFQPSEFAKLAVVFCLARYFSQRMVPGGYSLGSLLRPLNPSRPLAALVALGLFWSNPWLTDPFGQLARLLHTRLGGVAPSPADLWWFRALLVLVLVAFTALTIVAVLRLERRSELLNPWSAGRRRRLIAGVVILGSAFAALVAWQWRAPVVRDPFGVAIAHLVAGAAPGGPYEDLEAGLGLRLPLLLAALAYVAASLLRLRQGVSSLSDVLLAPIDLLLVPAALVLIQPDLGTAGVVILIGGTMMLVVGVRLRSLVLLAVFGAMVAGVGWFGILKDYQKRRILTFIDPEHDTQGAGWNAVQSMIAVGSGRWIGKGHKGGTQTQLSFLPEQHTDFAFSVWAEEQGFLGSAFVVLLYLALIVMALSIAAEAREHYGGLLATGAAAIILWQALINTSMVIGAFPVVGIPLPLFSYGGSSILTVMVAVGVLLNVHRYRRAHG